ncbi:MAG: phosphoribosylaminoimidazolesuccinocarboxamide synthase [Alphaproteobacteria bacterium]|nr:phosphoribosylaminoimidazolesuccinocarboxamide synthase [Alphaproteobacteria bacterium]
MTNDNRADLQALIAPRVDDVLVDAHFPELPGFGRGKVRDFYDLDDGRVIMVATDRQSAFDQVLAAVPFKGQVLTSTARYWFDATADIVANHVIEYPDPNVMIVRKLKMLPVEMVVRDYLTGSTSTSIWPMYKSGQRHLYGIDLPDGLQKNQKLPGTILTPTTKAEAGEHDMPITPAEIVEQGLMTQAEWDEVAQTALAVFARGRELAAKRGLILVDTKYEFGRDEEGCLTLADEIHTPDSSRYWIKDSYAARLAEGQEPESLDKEFLRLWITARCDPYRAPIPTIPPETLVDFSARYISLYETMSGNKFELPSTSLPVRERVWNNLKKYVK